MNALYKGFIVTAISSLIILHPITDFVPTQDKRDMIEAIIETID